MASVDSVFYEVGESVNCGFDFGNIWKSRIDWEMVCDANSQLVQVSVVLTPISFNKKLRTEKLKKGGVSNNGWMIAGGRSSDGGVFWKDGARYSATRIWSG